MKSFLIALLFLLACGRESSQKEQILSLNEFVSESYDMNYTKIKPSYDFHGTVIIAGAGLHLRIQSKQLRDGYLFLVLHSAPRCDSDFSKHKVMWNLNSDFFRNISFDNGYDLREGKVKESFDFYLLKKFLKTPKRGFYSLKQGERFSLDQRTLLFYYGHSSIIDLKELILLGCAQFHST